MKRRFSVLSAVFVLFLVCAFALPSRVHAATIASGSGNGDLYQWKITSDGDLIFTGTSWIPGDSTGNYDWKEYKDNVTRIIIEEGLTSVPSSAFSGMKQVSSVKLPKSLTTIDSSAFRNMDGLKTITIPANVTKIGSSAFYSCDNLKTVKFASGSKLSSLGESAFSKTALTSIDIPDKVKKLNNRVFYECTNLKTISLPAKLEYIGSDVFYNCKSLERLSLPASMTSIIDNFYQCNNLRTLEVSNAVAVNTLRNCPITTLIVHDSATTLSQYYNFESLVSVTLPDSLETIREGAFRGCSSLSSINWPKNLKKIENYAFAYCSSLTSITWPEDLEIIGDSAFRGTGIKELHIPDSVTVMGENAFASCYNLRTVTVGKGLTEIPRGAFSSNNSLVSVNTGNVQAIRTDAFRNCPNLTSIKLPKSLTAIDSHAFYECFALETIRIPAKVTSIGFRTFMNCTGLKTVYFEGNAPTFADDSFSNTTADMVYPAGNSTWTAEIMLDYGGTLNWRSCAMLPPEVSVINKMTLTWKKISKASYYEIFRLMENETEYTLLCTTADTQFTDSGVPVGKNCTYQIRAVDSKGNMSDFSTPVTIISQLPAPVISESNDPATGTILLEWTAIKNSHNYEIYRATSKNGTYRLISDTNLPKLADRDVTPGKVYYYKIKAIHSNQELSSEFSAIASQTCDLPYPTVSSSVSGTTGKIKLTWKEITGAVEYCIYRSTEADGKYTLIKTVTSTKMTDSDTTPGTLYYYKVKAIHSKSTANSAYSLPVFETRALPAPVLSGTNNPDTGKALLTWEPIEGAIGYEVSASTTEKGDYETFVTTTECSAVHEWPTAGMTWYYQVRAIHENPRARSGPSNTVCQTTVLPRPVVNESNATTTGKVKLTWDKIDGAEEYKIYRRVGKSGDYEYYKATTSTSYTDKSTTAGTVYYYKIKAIHKNTSANSAKSVGVGQTCKLARPEIDETNDSTTGKVKLTWDKIEGAKEYQIYRRVGKDGDYKSYKTVSTNKFTDTDNTAGTVYYYKVKAIHSNSSANSAQSAGVGQTCKLAQPVIEETNDTSTGHVKLTWEKIEGAKEYKIYRRVGKTGDYEYYKTTTSNSYTDTSTTAGTAYYYKVTAIHSNSSANSAQSAGVGQTCKLARPDVTISLSSGNPKLTWDEIEGAEKYEVYRATSKSGTYSMVKSTTSLKFTDKDVTEGTTYYYKVKAIHSNSNANSAYSSVDSITAK